MIYNLQIQCWSSPWYYNPTYGPSCCPNAPITECWGVDGYLSGGHGAGYMSRCGCGGGGAPTEDAPWSGCWCAASVPYLATSSSHPSPRRVHQWLHRVTVTSRMGSTRHSTTVITTASFLHLHTLQGAVLRSALQILLHTRGTAAERIALFWNSECCGSHVITAVLRFLGSDYHYPQHPRHCNNAIHDNNVTHLIWNCSSGCIEPTQYFYLLSTGNTHFILNSLVIVDDATDADAFFSFLV